MGKSEVEESKLKRWQFEKDLAQRSAELTLKMEAEL